MAATAPSSGLVSDDLETRAITWRRRPHARPELSFEEHETSAFSERTLRSFGTASPDYQPRFDIDETALRDGIAVFARTALDALR